MLQKRSNFLAIIQKYANLKEKPRLTESTLFMVQDISPNKSVYSFDPLENASQRADELRLNINDEFIVTHLGVYLYGKVQDQANASNTSQLLTKLPIELLAVGQSMKAGNLWGGALSIAVNNVKFVEKLDLRRTNKAGQGFLTLDSNTSFDYEMDGMIETQPMVTLSGAKKNEINISLPDSLASFVFDSIQTTQTFTYTIDKVALRMYGLNAQNGAKFQA